MFLKELSKILTGAVDGEDAQDPGDPKTYFDIIKRDENKEQQSTQKPSQPEDVNALKSSPPSVKQAKSSSGEEDTSPPIKVNESQDYEKIRDKVRSLMRS